MKRLMMAVAVLTVAFGAHVDAQESDAWEKAYGFKYTPYEELIARSEERVESKPAAEPDAWEKAYGFKYTPYHEPVSQDEEH